MYQQDISPFGKYEKYRLADDEAGNCIELVPGFGCCVLQITLQDEPILDGYSSPEEMNINRWIKNLLLFPFPNRLKQGEYQWEGQSYCFPINDGQTGNALHGFGMDKPMKVEEVKLEKEEASLKASYTYDGHLSAYPFPFLFEVTFRISNTRVVDIKLQVSNTGGKALPFGMGWHPYFSLSDKVEDASLLLTECDMVGVGQNMIPTGKLYEFSSFASHRPIGAEVLDNCFRLRQQDGNFALELQGTRGRLRYWQEAGAGKFGYIQLFTPPHRQSLAIEPMSCNIDAFNNGEGLIRLEPGESAAASFGFQFDKEGL